MTPFDDATNSIEENEYQLCFFPEDASLGGVTYDDAQIFLDALHSNIIRRENPEAYSESGFRLIRNQRGELDLIFNLRDSLSYFGDDLQMSCDTDGLRIQLRAHPDFIEDGATHRMESSSSRKRVCRFAYKAVSDNEEKENEDGSMKDIDIKKILDSALKKNKDGKKTKVYFAGKMTDWRDALSNEGEFIIRHGIVEFSESPSRIIEQTTLDSLDCYLTKLPKSETKWDGITFVGPYRFSFFSSREERDLLYRGQHTTMREIADCGIGLDESSSEYLLAKSEVDGEIGFNHRINYLDVNKVFTLNTKAIRDCDLFVAYLSDETCFGTLSEIGFANGIGKRVVIFSDQSVSDDFSIFAQHFASSDDRIIIGDDENFSDTFERFLIKNDFIKNEYVYLMRAGDTQYYKIGRTKRDPQKRKNELNGTLAPFEIKLVCQIKTDDSAKLEKELHEKYKGNRERGEWFNLEPSQLFEIMKLSENFSCQS